MRGAARVRMSATHPPPCSARPGRLTTSPGEDNGQRGEFEARGDRAHGQIVAEEIARTPGGLLYWQVLELLGGLAAKRRIVGFDLVEFMPSRDTTGIAALTAARLVCNAIAGIPASQKRGR